MKWADIQIDDEFASYLPALTDEEREQLTVNMTRADANGDEFEPVTVWKGHGILLDGHHRYEIAQTLDMVLPIVEVSLPDRAACLSWMRDRQLGRRNLTPDQRRFYLGQKYNDVKGKQGGDRKKTKPQNAALKIAEEHGVSEDTVQRAGKFAEQVNADPAKKKAVMEGKPVKEPPKTKPAPPADDFLKRAKTRFNQVSEEVASLGRVLKELGSEDVGCYVNTARLGNALKEIRAVLKDALPVSKCGKCGGKGCILCKDAGYVTQAHLEG